MITAHKRLITGTALAAVGSLALTAEAFNTNEFSGWTQVGVAPNGGTFIYNTATSVRGTILPLGPGQAPLYRQTYAVGSVDHKIYLSEGGAWNLVSSSNGQGPSPSFYARPAAAAVLPTSVSDSVGIAITPYPGFMHPTGLFVCALSTQGIGTPLQTPLFKSVYCARNTDRYTPTGPFTANNWSAFSQVPNAGLPGFTYISRGPALVTDVNGTIWVAIQMTNGRYYWNRTGDGGATWLGWAAVPQPTATLLNVAPNLSAHRGNTADIFLLAAGSSALALTSGETTFSQIPNAAFQAAPSVFADGQYRMEASAIGLNGQVWRAVWSSPDGN